MYGLQPFRLETDAAGIVSAVTLADRLRDLRLSRGVSRYEAAKLAQMAQPGWDKLETGKTLDPGMDVLRRISEGFGVSIDFLVSGGEKDSSSIPPGENHDAGRPEHTVQIPVVGIAAGGAAVESDELREEFPLLRHLYKSGRYAIRLFGDSMYPTLWDKDLLLVEPATSVPNVPNGKIAVVRIGGTESTVKRVHRRKKDGSWILRSDNPRYQLIEAEADEVEIVARFLKIVEGDRQ